MKMAQAIARADELRPNALSEEQKAAWLQELDGQLAEMMEVNAPENTWPEEDRELLMGPPHEELYPLYLVSKIDYYNQESALYANDMAMYSQALAEATAWWRRNHKPRERKGWRVM